jgi:formylglycine-generating enzyme required for sulfatase activity
MTSKISLPLLHVGFANNKADITPQGTFGSVPYEYRISKTETTVNDYVAFLNAVARFTTDASGQTLTYLDNLYSAKEMGRDKQINAQIKRTGNGVSGYSYTADPRAGTLPIANTSWFSAARFANWMHNGQPIATAFTTNPGTETGAYTLDNSNNFPTRNPEAKYWIPSENEWYKAAFFDPTLAENGQRWNSRNHSKQGVYWNYPTRNNVQPLVGNSADFLNTNAANYNSIINNQKLNPVGSFNAASYYGLKDMAGSLWEWTDGVIANAANHSNSRVVRGGSWSLGFLNPLKSVRRDYTPEELDDDTGFRLASSEPATTVHKADVATGYSPVSANGQTTNQTYQAKAFKASSAQSLIEMVTVGDPNNDADSNGSGTVTYTYRIGKNEVTVGQYTQFLNSVATDPNAPLHLQDLYRKEMADPKGTKEQPDEKTGRLIDRTLLNGHYQYMVPVAGRESLPIAWVNWFSAARFANWMHNDPSQPVTAATTETGAYNLNGATTGVFIREPDAKFWIPTDDEWYKAAYYSPKKSSNGTQSTAGYWKHATQSDLLPSDTLGDFNSVNAANYNDKRQEGDVLTHVGSYRNSSSYYGTFDQTGNVWEWNDAVIKSTTPGTPDSRGMRGGSFSQGLLAIASSTLRDYPTGYRAPDGYLFYSDDDGGFRLASAPLLDPPA